MPNPLLPLPLPSHPLLSLIGVLCVLLLSSRPLHANDRLGGTLLYSKVTSGTWQIWQTDASTGDARQITSSEGDKRHPFWLPGRRIGFHTASQEVYATENPTGVATLLLADLWPIRNLVWSPNGSQVAFSRVRTDLVDAANLWVADAEGTKPRMLTQDPGLQHSPAWSPDGTRLVYVGGKGDGRSELYVLETAGGSPLRLTAHQSRVFLPTWSPDGAHMAYSSDASGDYEIWVMRADGSEPQQLTNVPGLDSHPAWSPDGARIAFTTNRTGVLQIWVMNPDGTNQRPLIQAEEATCDPAWR